MIGKAARGSANLGLAFVRYAEWIEGRDERRENAAAAGEFPVAPLRSGGDKAGKYSSAAHALPLVERVGKVIQGNGPELRIACSKEV